jgi:hypothetical protein
MRPKIAMWSDYRVPRHKPWRSPSRRSNRSSIGPTILVAGVVVVAGVIGSSGISTQIIDSAWVQSAGSHAKRTPVAASTTTRRTGIGAAIALSPRHDATTGEAATSTPRVALAVAEPPKVPSTVTAVDRPANETASTPADALNADAVAGSLPDPVPAATPPVRSAQRNAARAPVVKRRVVRTEHHRGYSGAYAQYGGGWGGWNGWPSVGSPYHF